MEGNRMGRYFEEFEVGQIINHCQSKTIFESDNNLFSLLTMNHHPVHINIDYCKNQQHGQVLVPGTLVFCLIVHMSVMDISGLAIANLGYENIEHLAPSFINDTLYSRTVILDKKESKSKNDRGIVYVETIGSNQNNIDIIKFRRKILIKKKGF
ncbi:MAG: dehydratase [Bacteroidetes bacterium RIFOXYA12_FULL_35_11]|nr:MAG: dehydratase [Bacteroidetes bacterium GWF2_35_48]OFY73061.1 MAG: dehydratase [Bacteroidetes bacterium RIFOXYA12_FULL_35_11]OFY94637.1 MAG: dehydratase [Bacteroidetes bacterium RIFOXYC12_FULL_35_7]HBX53541.1 dehydratase [Bacteroidales bacterium]